MDSGRTFIPVLLISLLSLSLATASDASSTKINSSQNSSNVELVAERIQNAFKSIISAKSNTSNNSPTKASKMTTSDAETGAEETMNSGMTTDFGFITVFGTTESSIDESETTKSDPTSSTTQVTSRPLTPEFTTTQKKKSPFIFTLLRPSNPSIAPRDNKTTKTTETRTTTGSAKDTETTDVRFITVYETTNAYEETDISTDAETTESSTRKTTRKTTTPSFPRTKSSLPATKKTSSYSSTKLSENGDTIYDLQNGVHFILKVTTASQTTKRPKTTSTTTSTKPIQTKFEMSTDSSEVEEEYYTTDGANASVLLGGAMAGAVPDVPGISLERPSVDTEAGVVFYFQNPAKFWAKYWYWILVVLLLIILLFIIPGFICQIYLSKWCRQRKLDRFFEKKSHSIFDFERIGFGFGRTFNKPPDVESEGSRSFSSPGTRTDSHATRSRDESSHPNDRSSPFPASSLLEEDAPPKGSSETKPFKDIHSVSENATVIVIPDPMSEVRSQQLSPVSRSSNAVDHKTSFEFPEPDEDAPNLPNTPPDNAISIYSQSDLGLTFGNEAIIKSTKLANHSPRNEVIASPMRPPKPEHMKPISKPPDLAPSNRPRQRSPPLTRGRRRGKDNRQDVPRNRGMRKIDIARASKRKEKSRRPRPSKKEKTKDDSNEKLESTTQSIMKATRSLEDILEAITKLTKEYPIPQLPDITDEKAKKNRKRRERPRSSKSPNKIRKDKDVGDDLDRYLPDEEMMRRKEKRTKNWANEQRKIEREKDKKEQRRLKQKRRKKIEEKAPEATINSEGDAKENGKKKIPTLKEEEVPPLDKTKQERRRMRLERDLKKLQKYHNAAAKRTKQRDNDDPK